MRVGLILISTVSAILGLKGISASAQSSSPDFAELYDLVRTNIAGMSQAEFNEAAVEGFVQGMGGRVSLVSPGRKTAPEQEPLIKTEVFNSNIGYFRVGQVSRELRKELSESFRRVNATNTLQGLVLDLRFAGGEDYQAAAQVADLFIKKAQPLLIWGEEKASSTGKAISTVPAAVLVNRETAGSAEALAGVLRSAGAALILGSQTAGRAMVMRDFELESGQRLRIATDPVRLGNGSVLPSQGLKPDITVSVSAADERAYYADAFKVIPRTNLVAASENGPGTNRMSRRPRFGEAELVRERQEGSVPEGEEGLGEEPETPVIYDPALARAIDVLKGLAVIRGAKS